MTRIKRIFYDCHIFSLHDEISSSSCHHRSAWKAANLNHKILFTLSVWFRSWEENLWIFIVGTKLYSWWKILRYKIWQFCVWWKINDVHRDETGDVCAFSSICDNYSPVRKSLKIHPFITLSTHHFRSQCTRERVRVPVITHVYIWIKLKPLFRDFNSTLSSIPVPAMRNGVAVAANTTKSSKNIRERERDVWGAQPTMKNVVLVFLFYVRQSFNNHKHVVVV